MKKTGIVIVVVLILAVAGYLGYEAFFPKLIAHSITAEESPAWMPNSVDTKIKKIRKPVNEMASAVIKHAHKSNVSIEDVLKAIDEAKEEQAYALLEELNKTEIQSTDQVFNMAKKHFPVDFDVEIFRETFNKKVTLHHIKKGLRYANSYKEREEFDPETAKSVAKQILLQKEAEFNKVVKNNP
ncbi:MAG TPA: hypothetical protein VD884_05285 [Ohtaekwangia sp.]|nr:hypothetical protein [Ohtaekwangia sp.]